MGVNDLRRSTSVVIAGSHGALTEKLGAHSDHLRVLATVTNVEQSAIREYKPEVALIAPVPGHARNDCLAAIRDLTRWASQTRRLCSSIREVPLA